MKEVLKSPKKIDQVFYSFKILSKKYKEKYPKLKLNKENIEKLKKFYESRKRCTESHKKANKRYKLNSDICTFLNCYNCKYYDNFYDNYFAEDGKHYPCCEISEETLYKNKKKCKYFRKKRIRRE